LKHWFQENGVVPWMRDRIPLLFRGGALVGVADLWISEEARTASAPGPKWRAEWTNHPPVR
jgi:tRNA(Ile)-lysidine synthase